MNGKVGTRGGSDWRIGMLWIGGPLSFLEQLCIKSFLDAGHETILYSYEEIPNAPAGTVRADANAILPQANVLRHERTNSPALHSDLFRYHLLSREDRIIWADTDAYCVKPFVTGTGHFHAWESDKGINGGVLGLPKDSLTLKALLDFTADEFAIPEWYAGHRRAELQARKEAGTPVHAGEMPWGVWGPHALTHYLKKTGEVRHTMPRAALYPFAYEDRRLMLRPGLDPAPYVTGETFSIHFYGRRMRSRIVAKEGGVPKPRSLIGQLLKKHGIDPLAAPIRSRPIDDDEAGDD
ncbi:MAG: hypothetical protein ACOY4T_05150 [Pseudomonadota bacterium]